MSRRIARAFHAPAAYASLSVALAVLVGAVSGRAQLGMGDWKTIKSKGHVLVDLDPLAKFLEAKVKFTKKTKAIAITKGKAKIDMRVGSDKAKVDGKEKKLPVPPQIVEGKTMVPLRWAAEALGAKVAVQDGGIISICTPPPLEQCTFVKMPE